MERSSRLCKAARLKGGQQGGNLPSAVLVKNDYPLKPFTDMNARRILSLLYNCSSR